MLVLATGFDAISGSMLRLNPKGRGGVSLKERWRDRFDNYLGLTIGGFPNLFMIHGPGSPGVFYNMPLGAERQMDWIGNCMRRLREKGLCAIEPTADSEEAWASEVSANRQRDALPPHRLLVDRREHPGQAPLLLRVPGWFAVLPPHLRGGGQRLRRLRVRAGSPRGGCVSVVSHDPQQRLDSCRGFAVAVRVKALRWIFGVSFGLAAVLAAVLAVACAWNAAAPPAADSESARLLASGPHRVATFDTVFVDASRPTDANGDFAGAAERTLAATLWFPEGAADAHPLLVYSHGFMSMRNENAPLAALLASHGYVVVSVDYPLTNFGAPGGPNVRDAVNQPDDVRFVIDRFSRGNPVSVRSPARSIASGSARSGSRSAGSPRRSSTFHPRLRDPRIAAAVSIAGPAAMFSPAFFATADVPFLMIAGTGDAMIAYASNAAPIPRMVRSGGLVSIDGASHAGFSAFAGRFPLRLLANPDSIGCYALTRNLQAPIEHPFEKLGGEAEGILLDPNAPLPCHDGTPASALAAGRQLMITRLAALAFFESRFAKDTAVRTAYDAFLRETLARDFPEATFLAAGSDERREERDGVLP